MKHSSILKSIAGSAALASVVIFSIAGIAHATGGDRGSMPGQGEKESRQSGAMSDQSSSGKENNQGGSAAGQGKSDKDDPSSWEYSRKQGSGSTGKATGTGSSSSQGSSTSGTR